jgi:DNA-binding LacI/PurR family transcriptional regulator
MVDGPLLAFVTDYLVPGFQMRVAEGADETARAEQASLVLLAAGTLGAASRLGERNFVLHIVDLPSVDGLLVHTGPLSNWRGSERLAELARHLEGIPTCSVGEPLGATSSVTVDNAAGMRALLAHLIEVHGHRRIAFICGPESNADASARLAAYRSVRDEYGLTPDEDLVVPGGFSESQGEEAVRVLLDERRQRFDALACASDGLALGAFRALEERGIQVPRDLALTGFDDHERVRYARIPFTTVRQPLERQGREGIGTILSELAGDRHGPKHIVEATSLVVRRSCGCSWLRCPSSSPAIALYPARGCSLEESVRPRLEPIARRLEAAAGPIAAMLPPDFGVRLVEALLSELIGKRSHAFAEEVEDQANRVGAHTGELGIYQSVLGTLRAQLLPVVRADTETYVVCEELWHNARMLIGAASERAQAAQRFSEMTAFEALERGGESMQRATSRDALRRALQSTLVEIGAEGCALGICRADGPALIDLAWHRSAGIVQALSEQPLTVDTLRNAWPGRRFTVSVLPLSLGDRRLGVLALEMRPKAWGACEPLARRLSMALAALSP